ncbi:MAG: ABC transporter permease, partial [Bacteroidetes bacterium]|nr:ABC transporter permease [Bacteroidota bacterium]
MSFFRTTLRNAWKNKSYTSLNVLGLAVGIACAGLIFLWVEDEMGYDSMYVKKNQLYWVRELQTYEGAPRVFNATPGPLAAAMKEELPGVVNTCRSTSNKKLLFSEGEKTLYENGFYADSSFFHLFTTEFTEGGATTAFAQVHNIVITQGMARRFFGTDVNIVGRSLLADDKQSYTISGVIRDVPRNSSLQFDWLIPFEVFMQGKAWLRNWPANGLRTYVELAPSADVAAINRRLDGFIHAHDAKANARAFLFAMNDWRLRDHFEGDRQTGGRITYIRLFVIIAWIILFIACINFMNLATARSDKRAREVGVRKVLGAARHGLALQFIGESLFLSAVSVLLGMLIIALVMPAFNMLVEKQLHAEFLRPAHLLALLAITLLCGLAAGSYPALYLSSFNPVFVFKGIRVKGNTPALIRRGLVVLQFTISIVLIICTIVIYQQIQHIRQRDIGYNRENLLDTDARGDVVKNFSAIRHDLLGTGLIENAALASNESIQTTDNTDSFTWDGKAPGTRTLISLRTISPEYFSTMG